jgi:hypothetical protein
VDLQSSEEVRGRVHELLQSPAWSRAWLAVLDNVPAPADDELERAGQWVDSREVIATDRQHCDWCEYDAEAQRESHALPHAGDYSSS